MRRPIDLPRRGEDWDIFEVRAFDHNRIEIEKCDTSDVFANDDDAAAFVIQTACNPTADDAVREECRHAIRQLVDTWNDEDGLACRLR
ncbi:MAG: hypothetical protein KY459_09235 [Acidobacteria bacterium]|nr:hypothetical protein [Acidobacteriota bacterium]